MKQIGITGGIGSGKSNVCRCFEKLGSKIIDADKISHSVLTPSGGAYPEVVSAFGSGILNPDKTVDRKKLAEIVFSDSEKLEQLNQITHPAIFAEMERQIHTANTDLVCLDVPLLFSSDFPFVCDATVAVVADSDLRIQRILKRDGCTEAEAKRRIAAQLSDDILIEKSDYVLYNNGTKEELAAQVKRLYHKIME